MENDRLIFIKRTTDECSQKAADKEARIGPDSTGIFYSTHRMIILTNSSQSSMGNVSNNEKMSNSRPETFDIFKESCTLRGTYDKIWEFRSCSPGCSRKVLPKNVRYTRLWYMERN